VDSGWPKGPCIALGGDPYPPREGPIGGLLLATAVPWSVCVCLAGVWLGAGLKPRDRRWMDH